jgi:hypothetical protein
MNGYWFTSSMFTIEPGEDEETNPGRYGRRLAIWLKAQLEQRGYSVEAVIAEDWGRCLMVSRDPFLLFVGCGNVDGLENDASDDTIVWHCFTAAEVPLLKRLFGKLDSTASVSQLSADLHAVLNAEPAITLVEEP